MALKSSISPLEKKLTSDTDEIQDKTSQEQEFCTSRIVFASWTCLCQTRVSAALGLREIRGSCGLGYLKSAISSVQALAIGDWLQYSCAAAACFMLLWGLLHTGPCSENGGSFGCWHRQANGDKGRLPQIPGDTLDLSKGRGTWKTMAGKTGGIQREEGQLQQKNIRWGGVGQVGSSAIKPSHSGSAQVALWGKALEAGTGQSLLSTTTSCLFLFQESRQTRCISSPTHDLNHSGTNTPIRLARRRQTPPSLPSCIAQATAESSLSVRPLKPLLQARLTRDLCAKASKKLSKNHPNLLELQPLAWPGLE
ncbi:hypothetical protein BDP81DRAFT_448865 [Colletotrichum phormii]|uniref:Uncharacterized protein n=1 Tax=Colletotrichum phormii TaxID=359342 RepID=A0AAJ0EG53_9PEZI|nr:uncharacterized protein BDP81DRAFT_448865 [Colletotrichum phormii]KAK1637748.1 hypothetical protein BDP81DRAFT_448865 [Colletotrichum phormii]